MGSGPGVDSRRLDGAAGKEQAAFLQWFASAVRGGSGLGARGRDRTQGASTPSRGVPARAETARPRPRLSPALALGGLGLGLALLAWTTRNALHGAPVADDFAFLAHIRLDRFDLFDLFDGGGFPY